MNLIERLFKFYINSSLHIAVSVLSLCFITTYTFEISFAKNLKWFILFASVLGYNYIKYFGVSKFYYRSLTNKLKEIQILSGLCFLGVCVSFFGLNTATKLIVLFLGAVTFFYEIPFEKIESLRKVRGLKIYIIALVWSLTTVLLVVVNAGIDIDTKVLLKLFERFIFVFVLMLPFEIRDLDLDDLRLSTIPQKIGIVKTKQLGFFGLFLIELLELFIFKQPKAVVVLTTFIMLVTAFLILKTPVKRNIYYAAFWVEAVPVLWASLIWFFL